LPQPHHDASRSPPRAQTPEELAAAAEAEAAAAAAAAAAAEAEAKAKAPQGLFAGLFGAKPAPPPPAAAEPEPEPVRSREPRCAQWLSMSEPPFPNVPCALLAASLRPASRCARLRSDRAPASLRAT
jgi:hypothetical protein